MPDMKGKRCLVTGATNGIGRAAALELARMGAGVVLVGRDAGRTRETAEFLRKDSGNPDVTEILGDLSCLAEARRVAREYAARHDRLDVLLNNAGGFFGSPLRTKDGYEMTFALNHLAYHVVTRDLLHLVEQSAPARIINVSSGAHASGSIDFDDLMGDHSYNGIRAYSQSKLANVMFTRELSRRLAGTGVTVNAMHPGVVRTNFGREHPSTLMKVVIAVANPFMLTPEQGADTAVWLASSPDVAGVSGKYFIKRKEQKVNKLALDDAACARLWDVSEALVSKAAP